MPGLVPGIYVLRTCEVDGRVIEDVLALAKMHKAVIACDKREAFAQGSEATCPPKLNERRRKQSIHPLCSDMDCFRLR
jgi:hypothetical protein